MTALRWFLFGFLAAVVVCGRPDNGPDRDIEDFWDAERIA